MEQSYVSRDDKAYKKCIPGTRAPIRTLVLLSPLPGNCRLAEAIREWFQYSELGYQEDLTTFDHVFRDQLKAAPLFSRPFQIPIAHVYQQKCPGIITVEKDETFEPEPGIR